MISLRYTLLSDGPSDRALMPILTWLILEHLPDCAIQAQWADLRRLPVPPKGLANKITTTLDLYPCDLLFIHRDAEREPFQRRLAEIEAAVKACQLPDQVPVVPVVPVRMQEAWLLIDESAIRRAAGNPNGREAVRLPPIAAIEAEPNPKQVLRDLLQRCSGLHGRRLQRFPTAARAARVAEFISDPTPLRRVSSFQFLEARLVDVIGTEGWSTPNAS